MARWLAMDAKQKFADLVKAANNEGPQVVMRHTEPVAIVMSPDDYRRLKREADANFAKLLSKSPFSTNDVQPVGMSLGD